MSPGFAGSSRSCSACPRSNGACGSRPGAGAAPGAAPEMGSDGAVGAAALAGDPADAADELPHQLVASAALGVGGAEVPHAGHPGPAVLVPSCLARAVDDATVVALAPADRVIRAHRVRARVVRRLVERKQHVVGAAHAANEV